LKNAKSLNPPLNPSLNPSLRHSLKNSVRNGLSLLLFALLLGAKVFAANEEPADLFKTSSFQSYEQYDRTDFLVGGEYVSLKNAASQLSGMGVRLGVDYALDPRWSINPNLALVYNADKFSTYLYSGINGLLGFNWKQNNMLPKKEISYAGKSIFSQTNSRAAKIITFVGIEQLFLNGSVNVYPAAGVTAGLKYVDSFWGTWTEFTLRGSSLTANNLPLTAMYLNVSFLFGL
jgi:hypothetical protein